jgi:hypothetical protein
MTTLCIRFRNMILSHNHADRLEIVGNLIDWFWVLVHDRNQGDDELCLTGLQGLRELLKYDTMPDASIRASNVWNSFSDSEWSASFRAIVDADLNLGKVDPVWWYG